MLRLTELKLPLDHPPEALRAAILQRLELADDALVGFSIFKRSYDARKKHALLLIYAVDVEVKNEAALLKKFRTDRHLAPTPDMAYRFVGQAPENLTERPIVVGFGPCGIFAALVLAQMGFKPMCWSAARRCANARRTPGAVAQACAQPESNVQFGEGGRDVFRRQALQPDQGSQASGPQGADRVCESGRAEEILYVSKPHIGTFRLVGMVETMRHEIEQLAARSVSSSASPTC